MTLAPRTLPAFTPDLPRLLPHWAYFSRSPGLLVVRGPGGLNLR